MLVLRLIVKHQGHHINLLTSMSDNDCSTLFIKNIDQCIINYDNIIGMGDLNFDMLNDKKCQALKDLCDVLDVSQLVLKPTCFMKNCIPSLGTAFKKISFHRILF
jgi:hypothetical protein